MLAKIPIVLQTEELGGRAFHGRVRLLVDRHTASAAEMIVGKCTQCSVTAGLETEIGCHTFRATGITAYLKNGGKLEIAQQMAAHEVGPDHRPL
jgi:hypothetical protein